MLNYTSVVNIPAYDSSKNGLIIKFKLTAASNNYLLIKTCGQVAAALERSFKRIIEIMSALKKSWECLELIHYTLECTNDDWVVRDAKSSSMALSIALINVSRVINGQSAVPGLSGTGILRMDGSFDSSHWEEEKYFAAKNNLPSLNQFITSNECKNLFELENLINQFH